MISRPVIVVGAGGHARVVVDVLHCMGVEILGVADQNPAKHGTLVLDVPVLGGDDLIFAHKPKDIVLANGVGSVRQPFLRQDVHNRLAVRNFSFMTIRHPSAVIAQDVLLEPGVQVMAGAVIQPGTRIGTGSIINTGAIVDHDCAVGAHTHIAPRAVLSGHVVVGETTHIGTGAVVIQCVKIGSRSLVAAGTVVVSDIGDEEVVKGAPARRELA